MVTVHFYSVAVTHTKNAAKATQFFSCMCAAKKSTGGKPMLGNCVGFSLPQIDTHNTVNTQQRIVYILYLNQY
jgi:hypothetical protein